MSMDPMIEMLFFTLLSSFLVLLGTELLVKFWTRGKEHG